MADQVQRLYFDLIGRDRGATKAMSDLERKSLSAHLGLSKLGSSLTGLGGPMDQVVGIAGSLGDALDGALGKAQRLGLGMTVVGVALIAFAAKEQQAQSQLKQAIDNTGASYGDYKSRISDAVKQQENFGHSTSDTQNALNELTTATQDPTAALNEMGLAANVAAEKNETLAEAAHALILAQQGNVRELKSLGVNLDGVGSKSGQLDRALRTLGDHVRGQAAAAVDTFGGRLKIAGVRLEDQLASLGKYGPALTAAGAALTAVASIEQLVISRRIADTLAANTQAAAIERVTAAKAAETGVTAADATANAALTESRATGILGSLGGGLGLLGKLGKGLGIAGVGYLGAQLVGSSAGGSSGHYISDIGEGAAIGAGVGSVVPVIGTGVGAAVGAGAGLLASVLGGSKYDQTALNQFAATPFGAQAINKRLAFEGAQGSMSWAQIGKANNDPRYNFQNGLSPKQLDTLTGASDKQLRAALDATKANRSYAESLLHESDAATKAALSLDGQIKALQTAEGKASALKGAEDDLQGAMHDMAQSAHDGGRALDGHTAAAEANRAALRGAVDKMVALIAAQKAAGVSGDKVRATAVAMSEALKQNAGAIFGNRKEVDAFLRQLKALPPQIASALGATELLSEQIGEQVMSDFATGIYNGARLSITAAKLAGAATVKQLRLSDLAGGGAPQGSYIPKNDPALKAAQKTASQVVQATIGAYPGAVDSASKSAAQSAAQNAVNNAKQALQQIIAYYRQEKKTLVDAANITQIPTRTDSLGSAYATPNIKGYLHQEAREMETFARLYKRLAHERLNPTLLDQLASAGVAAIPAMRELLAGGMRELHDVNRSEARIQHAAANVASLATSEDYGRDAARELSKLPHKLAHEIAKELRHLHITVDLNKQDRKNGHKATP